MSSIEDLIKLNLFARAPDIAGFVTWFDALTQSRQREILDELKLMVSQAKPVLDDGPAAVQASGLRSTFTPCVLLSRGYTLQVVTKIVGLPADEYRKSAALLLTLFAIADRRRRETQCASGCSHWWHRDLTDPAFVAAFLA
jgi:hypothetical protein